MAEQIRVAAGVEIPAHLQGDVQAKLAYVDELIAAAEVAESGQEVALTLRAKADAKAQKALEEKVQRVVAEMAKGAVAPKVEVLEDHLARAVPYGEEPMTELLARGEVKIGRAHV